MTRNYSKHHEDAPVDDPLAPMDPPAREKTISELHEEEIEAAKLEIAALVEKAREVQHAREDPLSAKPEHEFVVELQAIFKQVHALNAKWLARDRGYAYEPPPFVAPAAPPPPPAPEDPLAA